MAARVVVLQHRVAQELSEAASGKFPSLVLTVSRSCLEVKIGGNKPLERVTDHGKCERLFLENLGQVVCVVHQEMAL